MFKFWKIEKRRRAIIMRENMARRTLIRTNPQYGPFRPIDIHECSSDSDDEPTVSVAPAASDVPTAAPGRSSQPIARIDRALDVLNAPCSTRQEFQAYFNPRNLGPGDLEELSPELWEEFRLDGAADEYPQGYQRPQLPQLQTYPEPLYQVWRFKTLSCTEILSLNFRL